MTKCTGQTKKGPCTNKAMYVVGDDVVCFIHLQTSLKQQLGPGRKSAVVVRLVTGGAPTSAGDEGSSASASGATVETESAPSTGTSRW